MCRGISHSYGEHPWLLTTHQPCLWLPTTLLRPSRPQGRPWASSTQSRCPTSGSRVTPAQSSSRGCPRGSRSESLAPLAPRTWRGSSRWLTRSSSPSPGTQGTGEERGGKGWAGPRVVDPWPGLRVILAFQLDKAAFPAPPGSWGLEEGGLQASWGAESLKEMRLGPPHPPYTIAGAAFMGPVSLPWWLLAAFPFPWERGLGPRQRGGDRDSDTHGSVEPAGRCQWETLLHLVPRGPANRPRVSGSQRPSIPASQDPRVPGSHHPGVPGSQSPRDPGSQDPSVPGSRAHGAPGILLNAVSGEFPGCPGIRTRCSHCPGPGFDPRSGN